MAENNRVTVDMTTGIGTLSFPHLFESTKTKNDKGEDVYDLQFLLPKSDRESVRALMAAIKKVGEAKWGANWKKVRNPLRDGDKEKDEITDDGKTKGEKYPERLGCYFINARSSRPVSVVDRSRTPLLSADAVYGGCKVKINISLYPYAKQGNQGIGVGLNGVQKISDGEPFGNARPSVEAMFDEEDGDDLDYVDEADEYEEDEVEEAPPARRRPATKKAAAPKRKAEVIEDDDIEDDEVDEYDDLED